MGSSSRFSKSRNAFTAPGIESSEANTHAFSSLMFSNRGSHPGTYREQCSRRDGVMLTESLQLISILNLQVRLHSAGNGVI